VDWCTGPCLCGAGRAEVEGLALDVVAQVQFESNVEIKAASHVLVTSVEIMQGQTGVNLHRPTPEDVMPFTVLLPRPNLSDAQLSNNFSMCSCTQGLSLISPLFSST